MKQNAFHVPLPVNVISLLSKKSATDFLLSLTVVTITILVIAIPVNTEAVFQQIPQFAVLILLQNHYTITLS